MKKRWLALWLAVCLLLPVGCARTGGGENRPSGELRGVWVSYLELDPLLADADVATAAARLDELVARCAAERLNTVFFHVRAYGDAYYPSTVYPSAEAARSLLEQGFDPLAYAVKAAHAQGLALHAWINPYRLGAPTEGSFQKDGTWYLNPATATRRVLDGVEEILTAYEVDGIHFDDYFYPADMAAQGESFERIPDGIDVAVWRQTQVDDLISRTYSLCRRYGRLFGVSPVADPEKSHTVYYADVARWMAQPGYVDYVCPQLYTGFQHETQPFDRLLAQWAALPRREGVALYVGLALYKAGLTNDPYAGSGRAEWAQSTDIIKRQILSLRETADGFALFRYNHLLTDNGAAAWTDAKTIL